MSTIIFLAVTFAAAYVLIYLAAVDQIRRKQVYSAYPQFEPRAPGSMPPAVRQRFVSDVTRLEELGFSAVAYLHNPGMAERADGRCDVYCVVLRNEESGDLAQLVEMSVRVKHVSNNAGFATFVAELPGGACVGSSNSPIPGVFRPDPRRRVLAFPDVKDVGRLYRVHRALVERDAPGRKGVLPTAGMEVPHVCEWDAAAVRRQVECGYLYLNESRGTCGHTWKGALVMTAKLMFGIKDVRMALAKARSRATLNSLGLKAA